MSDLYLKTLECLSVKQLKKQLSHYGMPCSGKKRELIQRLLEQFEQQNQRTTAAIKSELPTHGNEAGAAEITQQQTTASTAAAAYLQRDEYTLTHNIAPTSTEQGNRSRITMSESQQSVKDASEYNQWLLPDDSRRHDNSSYIPKPLKPNKLSKANRKAELRRQLAEMESDDDDSSSNSEHETNKVQRPYQEQKVIDKQYNDQRRIAYDERMLFERLPTPTPPVFDGNILLYSDWKVAFDGLIDHLPLTASQKFYYLKQYLSGKALNAVSSYFVTNTDRAYEDARKLLNRRFGDPFLLFREIRSKLQSWPRIGTRDAEALRDFSDFLAKCLTMMDEIDSLKRLDDVNEIQELTHKLPDWCANKWNDKAYDYREKHNDYPKFVKFVKFLRRESDKACDSVYSMAALKKLDHTLKQEHTRKSRPERATTRSSTTTETKGKPSTPSNGSKSRANGTLVMIDPKKCVCCEDTSHQLPGCTDFAKKSIEEREKFIRDNRLCFGCLIGKHKSKECKWRETCIQCGKKHPTLLHRDDGKPNSEQQPPKAVSNNIEIQTVSSSVPTRKFFSMVVPVYISSKKSPHDEVLTYALLDSQSDTTFALTQTVDQLGASYKNTQLKLSTMTSKDQLIKTRLYKDLRVRGYFGKKRIDLPSVYTREYIPAKESHIPTSESVKGIGHLKHLAPFIAPKVECEVGLLIGYDCSHALLPRRVEAGLDNQPFAVETDLGWSVVGGHLQSNSNSGDVFGTTCNEVLINQDDPVMPSATCFRVKSSLKEIVAPQDVLRILNQDFKDVELRNPDFGNVETLSQNDIRFINIMKEGIHQDENGYYTMPLPLKDTFALPDNRWIAEQRFKTLIRRLNRDKEYCDNYMEFMRSVFARGEAEPVVDGEVESKWYLPHHGVIHPRKPGKVRVVFDCSAKCEGISLNDILLPGPDMNNTLLGVLLRFRLGEVALMCDIERMFFQFRVPPENRNLLRFLWFDSDGNIQDYRMKVHLFGATSSPSCAIFGLKQLVEDFGNEFPMAKKFVRHHFYVDDGLISTDSAAEAIQIASQSINMCKHANIRLCKFTSNDETVLSQIPESERAPTALRQELFPQVGSALGVTWLIDSDEFRFRLELKDTPLSRRGILSTLSSVYDPLGLIAPVILQGKLILKHICESGSDWDDELPDEVCQRWQKWRSEVLQLQNIKIPRCVKSRGFVDVVVQELHHFSDASQLGYGCCSFLRQVNKHGDVTCALLMAKSRVTPSKVVTIPRLELQAAALATRLSKVISRELNLEGLQEYFHTDSEIVLGYITNDAKRFKPYVANRVQQIRNCTEVCQWKHVRTHQNPADYASRGATVSELKDSIWLVGPNFLHQRDYTPADVHLKYKINADDPEVKSIVCYTVSSAPQFITIVERLKRFSKLHSAVRAVEVLQRWIQQVKAKLSRVKQEHIIRDYSKAVNFVVTVFQNEAFSKELSLLSKGDRLPRKNKLCKLDPFIDRHNVLRVGGRLSLAHQISDTEKCPIIVPRKSHLATLIVRDCHSSHHQGRGITIAKIRERGYWIIGCTAVVKSYIHHCIPCRKLRYNTQTQKMADLPKVRTEELGPFVRTGMDCFGPFPVKDGRRHCKRYGVIFTCLSTRAVHIELLDDLSSDAFINALRCLIAVRGQVLTLLSDQGTNFKGANSELRKALDDMDDSKLKGYLTEHMIDFQFNPPAASHMGGVWERHIRTIRSILNALLSRLTHPPDSTTLRAFLYETMAIINARPLTYHTLNDPTSVKPLTPNDILLMKSSVIIPPPGSFKEDYPKKRWHYVQVLTNQFWKRWRREYLQELQTRQRWSTPRQNMKPGDIVLIEDENQVRGNWSLGRVDTVYPGSDNLVRKARIAVSGNLDKEGKRRGPMQYLERPVHKLVLLMNN